MKYWFIEKVKQNIWMGFLSILFQIIGINTFLSVCGSVIALRNDISNYNDKLEGKDPQNESTTLSMK